MQHVEPLQETFQQLYKLISSLSVVTMMSVRAIIIVVFSSTTTTSSPTTITATATTSRRIAIIMISIISRGPLIVERISLLILFAGIILRVLCLVRSVSVISVTFCDLEFFKAVSNTSAKRMLIKKYCLDICKTSNVKAGQGANNCL